MIWSMRHSNSVGGRLRPPPKYRSYSILSCRTSFSSWARSSSIVGTVFCLPHYARSRSRPRQSASAENVRIHYGGVAHPPEQPVRRQGSDPGFARCRRLCSNGGMHSSMKRALSAEQTELLRQLPSVDELLAQPRLRSLAERVNRELLVEVTRAALTGLRERITGGVQVVLTIDQAEFESHIAAEVERILSLSLLPVINATGVILHTNLGRAPLPEAVVEHLRKAATRYSNLEYDLEAGGRGKRDAHTAQLLARLTGAEAAIVVNNCAAAMLLSLAALARGGEVLVSRGELIEIGDGFRIPEVMAESGAILREVGTTNRTRLEDYARGIGEKTRLLLRVHRSNFHITGFTERPSLSELAELGRRSGLPVMEDLGSGCLVDLSAHGITEPVVRQSFEA